MSNARPVFAAASATVIAGSMKNNHYKVTGAASSTTITNTEKDLLIAGHNQVTAAIEMNYHNGSGSLSRRPSTIEHTNNSISAGFPSSSAARGQQNNNNCNKNKNNSPHSGRQSMAIINSISGSIPPLAGNNPNTSRGCASLGSDLNNSLNNSFTDLNNLHVMPPPALSTTFNSNLAIGMNHHHHHQHYQQQQQQKHHSPEKCSSEKKSGYCLWIMTPVAASISVAIVIAALAGPQWLYTEEKLPNANYNGTANFNVQDDGAFITKYTKSSLWILCTTIQGIETYNCIKIDYFPKEGYQPDPHDSTPAIPYTITKSAPFFLASGIFLLISFIVFLVPTCSQQNNLYYFSSGIMFIVSGLLMLIGLIAYISILKAEIGSKLRPRSTLQPALFKVTYGQSFFLFVFGFISTEFVGVLDIFLYISLQEVGYYSKLPCLSFTNIQAKIREGENTRGHFLSKSNANQRNHRSQFRRHHHRHQTQTQRHHLHDAESELELESKKLLHKIPGYTCKKHPMAATNVFFANDLDRRYFFEKQPKQKCDLHSKNLAKSLNELYTEPAPPLPPPAVKSPHQQQLQLSASSSPSQILPFDLPQEFPLTRSVSTTTELYSTNGNNRTSGSKNQMATAMNQNHFTAATSAETAAAAASGKEKNRNQSRRNQGTSTTRTSDDDDVDDDDDAEPYQRRHGEQRSSGGIQDICGLSRGIRKTKDELFNEFCKRAGVRPKPKNIYYIEEGGGGGDYDEHDDVGGGLDTRTGNDDVNNDERLGNNRNLYIVDKESGIHHQQHQHRYSQQDPQKHQRRNSMFVDPSPFALRKLNSNLSLHTGYSEKLYQKSLFDLDRCDSEIWNNYPEHYYAKGDAMTNNGKLQHNYNHLYQSQTLPRSFIKRNFESQENLRQFGYSQTRLAMIHQQQQQQHLHDRTHGLSRDSKASLHKSCENMNFHTGNEGRDGAGGIYPSGQRVYRQQAHLMPTVQWPAAIPTSPSNFSAKSLIFASQGGATTLNNHSSTLGRTASNASASAGKSGQGQYKFNREHATAGLYDAFDLDEIERERRRSHASLFDDGHYDMINGTAV